MKTTYEVKQLSRNTYFDLELYEAVVADEQMERYYLFIRNVEANTFKVLDTSDYVPHLDEAIQDALCQAQALRQLKAFIENEESGPISAKNKEIK
jgi:CCR4-NOT transcriptional regulation complex NOT5 subunit